MIVLATLVVFLISHLVPADPILAQLGDMQAANPAMVAAYRARWGLDLPVWQQYLRRPRVSSTAISACRSPPSARCSMTFCNTPSRRPSSFPTIAFSFR
ncbi:MAG: hypothetical protein R3D25_13435 [Geminicoccaceae bacterium]